ncbi:LYP1 [Candida jiufengensis]|uniref:LYP1 n=1 Tax=Candida jiufengensis TaxID=497108 RepID=UPI00222580FC|nr:LYP1 [Candida jiufengensis]KAI5954561.1 LYP1 [Candida jiufengensis]
MNFKETSSLLLDGASESCYGSQISQSSTEQGIQDQDIEFQTANNTSSLPQIHEPQHKHAATKRLLNQRHITMLSIGGIIGTGFFFGINLTLIHGPIISLISFIYLSFLSYIIIQSVGEMSCFSPLNGSLCQFQYLYISDIIGFLNNLIYWISWSITLSLELNLIFEILKFWNLSGLFSNQLVVILIFWVCLTVFNLFPVNYYGEIEFFITLFKVCFIISWIFLSIWLILTNKVGFKNWNRNLIWGMDTIQVVKNPTENKILNILSSLVASCFTFQSIESIALCSGEIQNIHKTLPTTVKYVISRLVIFYILTLFLLTIMVPSDDSKLTGDSRNIFASPFLIGLINCGLNMSSVILSIFNFIILMSIISAANSNIYFGSRCLISMVEKNMFWETFGKTNKYGIPYYAVLLTSILGLIPSLLSSHKSFDLIFKVLINLSATSGLLMWLFISISYIRFREVLKYNKLQYENLAFKSTKLDMIKMSHISIVSIIIIIISNGIINIWDFTWDSFWSCYLTSIIIILGWIVLSIKWKQFAFLKPISTVDIFTDQSPFAFKK